MNDHGTHKTLKTSTKTGWAIAAIIGFFCVVVGYWGWYLYFRNKCVAEHAHTFSNVAQDRVTRTKDLVQRYIAQGAGRVAAPEVAQAFARVADVKPKDLNSPELTEYFKKFSLFLEQTGTEFLYRNSMLVRPDGVVAFSDFIPEYVGKNLTKEPYSDWAVGQSYMRATMTLTTDTSDFFFDALFKAPLLVVSLPVIHENKFIGVLVQRVMREKIWAIFDDYLGLGDTGESIAGKKLADGILVLNRLRFDKNQPLKKFLPFSVAYGRTFPLALGASGYQGSGITLDYDKKPVVAAWQYAPQVNWGVTVNMSLTEVHDELYWWFLFGCLLTLLWVLFTLIISWYFSWTQQGFARLRQSWRNARVRKVLAWICICIALGMMGAIIFSLKRNQYKRLEEVKITARDKLEDALGYVENILADLEDVGQELANDLGIGRLKKEKIQTRLERDMAENPLIQGVTIAYAPYGFDADRKLYALYISKKSGGGFNVQQLDESYDYLKEKPTKKGQGAQAWSWYAQAIKEKTTVWFDPYKSEDETTLLGGYSIPFYHPEDKKHKNPLGVVNVVFSMDTIEKAIAKLNVGTTGYGFLISQSGAFIYYPLQRYISKQKTIEEFAQEINSQGLLEIGKRILRGEKGFGSYDDEATGYHMQIYFDNIARVNKWPIAIIFADHEAQLPMRSLRHYYMLLVMNCMLLMLALLWLLTDHELIRRMHIFLLTFIILIGLGGIIYVIQITNLAGAIPAIPVTNQMTLNQFLNERDIYAQYVGEKPPIKIEYGLLIYSMSFPQPNLLELSGYVWEKYPAGIDKKLIQEPQFPQAVIPVGLKKTYEEKEGDYFVIGWTFEAKLAQDFNFKAYPLDVLTIKIDIEHPDMTENIIFVPNFADYYDKAPEKLPGLFKYITMNGFKIKESFFSFEPVFTDTNLGLVSYAQTVNRYFSSYNIVLERRLLYEIMIFLLPIFIIFLLMFCLSWIAEKEWLPVMLVSAFTGLFFSTILLHRTLRDRYQASELLYIEYLFFMIYLTIVPFVLYLLFKVYLTREHNAMYAFFGFYRRYYWPIQLSILFVITMLVFYST